MGLITGLLTLPIAPVRGVAWITEKVAEQAELELYDEGRVLREMAQLDESYAAGVGSPVLTIHLFIPMDPVEYRAHAGVDEEAVGAFLRFYADACLARGVSPLIENVPPVLRMRTGGVFLSQDRQRRIQEVHGRRFKAHARPG